MRTSANDLFGKNSRPSTFYHHRLTTLMYSEGIKEMVETRKTVWILDVIIKLHYDYDYKVHNRTIWEVMRLRNNDLYVFATDPEGTVLAAEHIKDIEFIYDDATFWLVDHVLMFPLNYNYSYSSFKTKDMRTIANDFFGSSNGTGVYYQCNLSKMKYTDGVKDLAEGCEAYWLIDLIMSYQVEINEDLDTFQQWNLLRTIDTKFYIFAVDSPGHKLASQFIEFSDFKYDRATLWVMNDLLFLPCEW